MPTSAAPAYLGRDLTGASPGLRFGLLLPIWTNRHDQEQDVHKRATAKSREGEEVSDLLRVGMDHAIAQLRLRDRRPMPGLWAKSTSASRDAWREVQALSAADRDRMRALAMRQSALAAPLAQQGLLLTLDAQAVAPFTTGLGQEHPLENGFAFLNPYGLPYLPGSGVKGVLRQAARELADGAWGDGQGWAEDAITWLFGLDSNDRGTTHQRGALTFWDVVPQIEGDSLQVEVMTPHQGHYYQGKVEDRSGASVSPHDSGQPIPIHFLTVPPRSRFAFHVQCNVPYLARLDPSLAADGRWQLLVHAAMLHAFEWLGFGAKTAVGYGAFRLDTQADARRQTAVAQARIAEARKSLTPGQLEVEKYVDAMRARVESGAAKEGPNREWHQKAQTLAKCARDATDWWPEERRAAADAIEHWLPQVVHLPDRKDAFKKLQLRLLRGEG